MSKRYSSSNIWTVDIFLTIRSHEAHRHYDVSICMLKLLDTLLLAVTSYFLKLLSSLILRQLMRDQLKKFLCSPAPFSKTWNLQNLWYKYGSVFGGNAIKWNRKFMPFTDALTVGKN